MTETVDRDELAMLGYLLGVELVAKLSCATSHTEARDWIRGEKAPSIEQSARLKCVHRHLIRINRGEGPVTGLEWFTSADIVKHIHENNFAEVDRLASFHMYPNDN